MKQLLFILNFIFHISTSAQTGDNFELLFQWNEDSLVGSSMYDNKYNEVWGFVSNSREYGVIGSTAGTHIFDVTDPSNSSEIHFIPGADQGGAIIHRDYHDRNGYLYAVSDEGNSTLQIIDLRHLPDSISVVYDSNELIKTSHNIFIDESLNIMYACNVRKPSSEWTATSLALYDIEDPTNPIHLIDYEVPGTSSGAHDMWVNNDTAFVNNGYDGLYVVDFSDLSNPSIIGSLTEYTDKGYNHSGWPSKDMQTYIMADENWGYDMKVLDISDLSNISETTTFSSEIHPASIPHNQIVHGDYVYVSSYHDGLQVYDISSPSNPTKVGYFYTYLEDDHASYKGAWGVYPFLPSGNILVSDMQYGLYVLAPNSNFNISEGSNQSLNIYPNPANSRIDIGLPSSEKKLQIEITDLHGKTILKKDINASDNKVNLKSIKSGIYIINAKGIKQNYTQKLIRY